MNSLTQQAFTAINGRSLPVVRSAYAQHGVSSNSPRYDAQAPHRDVSQRPDYQQAAVAGQQSAAPIQPGGVPDRYASYTTHHNAKQCDRQFYKTLAATKDVLSNVGGHLANATSYPYPSYLEMAADIDSNMRLQRAAAAMSPTPCRQPSRT